MFANTQNEYETNLKPFENQVIIDFIFDEDTLKTDGNTQSLAMKWDQSHPGNPCHIIPGEDFMKEDRKCPPGRTRIYIVGHSNIAVNGIAGTGNIGFGVNFLCDRLAAFLNTNSNVVISILTCYGGKGNSATNQDSLGAQLHFKLFMALGKDIPVIARNTLTYSSNKDYRKKTYRLDLNNKQLEFMTLYENSKTHTKEGSPENIRLAKQLESYYATHQIGSKIIFFMDEDNNQIQMDAYEFKWKINVLRYLETILNSDKIDDVKVKQLFKLWLNSFSKTNKSCRDIHTVIKQELLTNNSIFNQGFFDSIFANKQAKEVKQIKKDLLMIIAEIEKIFSSPHKVKNIKTGNKAPDNLNTTNNAGNISQEEDDLMSKKGMEFYDAIMAELNQYENCNDPTESDPNMNPKKTS